MIKSVGMLLKFWQLLKNMWDLKQIMFGVSHSAKMQTNVLFLHYFYKKRTYFFVEKTVASQPWYEQNGIALFKCDMCKQTAVKNKILSQETNVILWRYRGKPGIRRSKWCFPRSARWRHIYVWVYFTEPLWSKISDTILRLNRSRSPYAIA